MNKHERCTNSYVQLEKPLLREASSTLLSSEKHDRNERLMVNQAEETPTFPGHWITKLTGSRGPQTVRKRAANHIR